MPEPAARRRWLRRAGGGLLALAALAAAPAVSAASSAASSPADGSGAPAAPRRPLEHFASLPLVQDADLSPDGQQLALIVNQGTRTAVVTRALAGGALKPLLAVDDGDPRRIRWVKWVNAERLLVGIAFASRRDFVGTVETRMVSLKADGGGLVDLTRVERTAGSMALGGRTLQLQDRVIDWLPGDGRRVLVALPQLADGAYGVYRVDVESGRRETVESPARGALAWLTDAAHRVRVGVFDVDDGQYEVRMRAPEGGAWRTLWRFAADGADAVWPIGFGADPQTLYVRALHEGRQAVHAVALDEPALPRRLLLAHPTQDIAGGLLRVPATGEVIGLAAGTDGDGAPAGEGAVWSPAWQGVQRALGQALPRQFIRLQALSHDGGRYLLLASGNGHAPVWYAGDREAGWLAPVAPSYPELADGTLRGKQRLRIAARDGLPLNAYLTLPAGRRVDDGGAALPMVLLPHGGPAARDDDDFDPWTEFLADRGFAVLQVNFRGSAGYGHAFQAAGLQRWGLEMQDDLEDAVRWAVGERIADAGRVCIVGASYGGYAALMGAVKTPALYRCAAGFAGVYDLPDLAAHLADYVGGRDAAERQFGDGWRDRERLRATSPARQAERIRVPVLLVHGSADRVAPVEQSRAMADALRGAKREFEYIELDGGDHHLSRQRDRLAWFKALEAFLDRHLAMPR